MSRTCGECTACCYALGVNEIDKPEFQTCPELSGCDSAHGGCESEDDTKLRLRGGGCGIYDDRPEPCKTYACLWLDETLPDEADRPDKLGVVFSPAYSKVLGPYVQVTEVIEGAVQKPEVRLFIELLGESHAVLHIRKTGNRVLMAAPAEIFNNVVAILREKQQSFKIIKKERLTRRQN